MRIIPKIAEQNVIKCPCCKSGDFVIIRTNICEERFMGYGMALNKARKLFVVCLDCGILIDSYWVMDNNTEYLSKKSNSPLPKKEGIFRL